MGSTRENARQSCDAHMEYRDAVLAAHAASRAADRLRRQYETAVLGETRAWNRVRDLTIKAGG